MNDISTPEACEGKELCGIGWAIEQMKFGNAVSREGWNGKGQYIKLQNANSKMTFPYVYIVPVQGGCVPWLCSQTDLLAVDWGVVEK